MTTKLANYPVGLRSRREVSLRNTMPNLLLILTFLLGTSISALAAEDVAVDSSAEATADSVDANPDEMDEITVRGARSLVAIERQILRADQRLYGISNTLIDDSLYKVFCRRETTAGSNIRKRVCRPGFERDLASDAWEVEKQMGRQGGNRFTFDYNLPEAELRKHRDIFKQKMMELAAEDPELADAILARAKLQREYAQQRQRQLGKED